MSRFRGKQGSFVDASSTSNRVLSTFLTHVEEAKDRGYEKARRLSEARMDREEIMVKISEILSDAFGNTSARAIVDSTISGWAEVGYNREPLHALIPLDSKMRNLPRLRNKWIKTLTKVCEDFGLEKKAFGLED